MDLCIHVPRTPHRCFCLFCGRAKNCPTPYTTLDRRTLRRHALAACTATKYCKARGDNSDAGGAAGVIAIDLTEARSVNTVEGAAGAVASDLTADTDDGRTPPKKSQNPGPTGGGGRENDGMGGFEMPSACNAGEDTCAICLSPMAVKAGAGSLYKINKCQVCSMLCPSMGSGLEKVSIAR